MKKPKIRGLKRERKKMRKKEKSTEALYTGLEGKKAVIFFENSDGIFTMHKVAIRNGEVNVGKLAWHVGRFPPFGWIKTMFGFVPFWIVNYKSALPIMRKDVIDPSKFAKITPQILGTILELKMLHFLLKRVRKLPSMDYTPMLMMLMAGMLVMYVLIYFKVIPI